MASLAAIRPTQAHAVGQLEHALRAGRMPHAYIVCGAPTAPREALAVALCLRLVCLSPTDVDGCNSCTACRKMLSGNHPDLHILGPSDKGSIGVAAIRDITARLGRRAAEAPVKLVRIDAADAMLAAAQNALLKTLEEPPGDTLFLLLTSRVRALLPTIRSRCQILRLAPNPIAEEMEDSGELQPVCAAVLQSDGARRGNWDQERVVAIWDTLQAVLKAPDDISTVMRVAAEWGADKEHTDIALALVEVSVRDALLAAYSGQPSSVAAADAAATADTLMRLRRAHGLHLNRSMTLEHVLMRLTGAAGASQATTL